MTDPDRPYGHFASREAMLEWLRNAAKGRAFGPTTDKLLNPIADYIHTLETFALRLPEPAPMDTAAIIEQMRRRFRFKIYSDARGVLLLDLANASVPLALHPAPGESLTLVVRSEPAFESLRIEVTAA